MSASFNYYSRKIHRYLGIFIGIQFFFWTLGGLYFSWTNIKEIRGDHLKLEPPAITSFKGLVSPDDAILEIRKRNDGAKLEKVEIIEVLNRPFYEFTLLDKNGESITYLSSAKDGKLQKDISIDFAKQIALNALVNKSKVKNVELLTKETVGSHHEYREKPLPAYAVSFEKPADLTVYVSAKTGKIESFRTTNWRIFDFLWMLHTMDYQGRDNINNYVLRAFSVLGIATIGSGFLLFFITSPVFRRKRSIDR